jgi:hypothetical protein
MGGAVPIRFDRSPTGLRLPETLCYQGLARRSQRAALILA